MDINNQTINQIKYKPFTIVSRLKGKNLISVNLEQFNASYVELAKLHTASLPVSNSSKEMAFYQSFNDSNLPKDIFHADLFINNALFADNQLSGIIDFYDACYDNYIYDIPSR